MSGPPQACTVMLWGRGLDWIGMDRARRLRASRTAVWSRMAAGRGKIPGAVPGENGSRRGSAGCCGAKCARRAAPAPGGGKSRKRAVAGGRPWTLDCAGDAVGSVQGLSVRVDTLSSLSSMRSVKWCRERQMTVYGLSYIGWSGGMCPSASRIPSVRRRGRRAAAAKVGGGVVSSGSMFCSTQCLRKLLKKNFRRKFWRI